jgi:hypothetical protein
MEFRLPAVPAHETRRLRADPVRSKNSEVMNEPEPPPIKYPPWVKKEILLPVFGIVVIGLMGGSYLVYRSIQKERQYSPVDYGPMDRRPSSERRPLGIVTVTNQIDGSATNSPPQDESSR